MQKKNLGWIKIGDEEWKAWIEDEHLVVHKYGKPRFIKALPLGKLVEHTIETGADTVKPKKAFPHPEFGFIAPA